MQGHAGHPLLAVSSLVQSLQARDVVCTPFTEADWGIATTIQLPSGGQLGLYQPKHALAH